MHPETDGVWRGGEKSRRPSWRREDGKAGHRGEGYVSGRSRSLLEPAYDDGNVRIYRVCM